MVFSTPAFSQSCDTGPCSVSPDYTVGSNISANATYHSTSGVPELISDVTILVCGDFYVDQDFSILTSTFVLTEDSRLIVEDGNTFFQVECTYYGCDGMWKGILVKTGGVFTIDQSFIYDAYVAAVKSEPGTGIIINQTTFDRNHISFWAEGPGSRIGCNKNTFYANNFNFNFPGGGQGNNEGKPWIAIDIFKQPLLIGGGSSFINRTRNNEFNGPFEFGIRTNQSVVLLENNQFKNQAFQRNGVWLGTAISSQNKSIHNIVGNTFENTFRGVESNDGHSSFTIKDNSFEEYTYAIQGEFTNPAIGIVKDNEIGTSTLSGHFGVRMTQMGSSLQTTDNTIFVDSRDGQASAQLGGLGIYHIGTEEGTGKIIGNDLTLYNASDGPTPYREGIRIDGQNNTEVFNNNIDNQSISRFDGFFAEDADYIRVEDNSIIANEQKSHIGMKIMDSDHVKYCCNSVSTMSTAVAINGNCNGSDFSANELSDSNYGLIMWFESFLGRQELKGNRWTGTFSIGAGHIDPRLQVIRGSIFVVPDLDQSEGPGTVTPITGWFEEDNFSDDTPCGAFLSTDCGEGPGLTPGLTDYDTLFTAGALDTILGDGSKWTQSQNLFSKMKKNTSLYGVYDVIDDWYDDQIGNIVEDYFLVRDTINRLFRLTTQQQDTVDRAMDTIEAYFTQLRYIDSLIFSDTITQWYTYDSIHAEIIGKIDSVYGIYLNTQQNIINARATKAQNLLNSNDQLSTPGLPTRYEKMYNEILLETVASNVDTFTLAQKDSLYVMASACPSDAGRAVYWAGNLYQRIEDKNFDIQGQCDTFSSVVSGSRKMEERTSELLIIPNPAEDYIELSGLDGEALAEIETVKIHSMSGSEVWSGRPGLNRRVKIGHLPAGIYSVLVVTSSRQVYHSKFIIQR